MKTKSIYKSVLIRGEWEHDHNIHKVKARRVNLTSAPDRLFFAHKSPYGNFTITEAYSGAIVVQSYHKETLESLIERANDKIKNQVPKKYKSFAEFVEDYVIRNNYLPLKVNLKVFAV